MGIVTNRTRLTSRGFIGLSPWSDTRYSYSVIQIMLGNNPLTKIEIVSALNSFNLAHSQYHFNYEECTKKYNPKVYLGAVQTASTYWLYDVQNGQTNGLPNMAGGSEKSGSNII